jgi:hypothetical protein
MLGGCEFQLRAFPGYSLHTAQMLALAAILAACSIAIALYAYVGYPMILWLLAKVWRRPTSAPNGTAGPA